MTPEEISRTVRVADAQFSVHFEPPSRTVRIYALPEALPETMEGIRAMHAVLAVGQVGRHEVVWAENSLGQIASIAASWTVEYVRDSDALLVFIDETGIEDLSDPAYSIFGLGGCAVRAEDYHNIIAAPWRVMKLHHFGGLNAPIHASELREIEPEQIQALADFFKAGAFYRLAALMDLSTNLGSQKFSNYEVVAGMLARNISVLVTRANPSSVSVVFESSERGDRLAKAFFARVQLHAGDAPIQARWGSLAKDRREPGLEVADVVIHTAGAQVRSRTAGRDAWRRDFKCVFQNVPPELVEYSHIRQFNLVENPEGTRPGILISTESVSVNKKR